MSAEQAANIIASVSPEGMVEGLVELTRENADLKAKLAQVQQDLENANRESLDYKNIYARTFESYKGLLADQKMLQADLDNWVKVFGADPKAAITREFAKERQSRIEAQTKLAQVEADAAVMREAIEQVVGDRQDAKPPTGEVAGEYDWKDLHQMLNAIESGSGQRLLDELAELKERTKHYGGLLQDIADMRDELAQLRARVKELEAKRE